MSGEKSKLCLMMKLQSLLDVVLIILFQNPSTKNIFIYSVKCKAKFALILDVSKILNQSLEIFNISSNNLLEKY